MNRREFAAAAGIGVGGLLFPQKVEASFVEPILRGLTNLQMAQKIADFPQGPDAVLLPDHYTETGAFVRWRIGCELRDINNVGICRSTWRVDETVIHGVWSKKSLVRRASLSSTSDKIWNKDFTMDVKDLVFIRFRHFHVYNVEMVQYRRLAVDGGFGWFTLKDQS